MALYLTQEKIEANRQKLSTFTQHTYNLSKLRRNNALNSIDADSNMLTRKQHDAMCAKNDYELPTGERDGTSFLEECSSASSSMLLGGNLGGKSSIRPIKLPELTKLPPYTTWIFLDRLYMSLLFLLDLFSSFISYTLHYYAN